MIKQNDTLDKIIAQGILPLFFYKDAEVSLQVIKTLYAAGIRAIEYTNRGVSAFDNFLFLKEAQKRDMPQLCLGVGTIKTANEAEAFLNAGADFIVSPIINPDVANLARRHNLLWIPGCMTPTEINIAQQHEAKIIKIFPANILGPEFISSIRDIFPGQLFIPTGGVDLTMENISGWFRAGVCAVGMGSKLITKKVLEEQQYDQLHRDTLKVMQIIQSCK